MISVSSRFGMPLVALILVGGLATGALGLSGRAEAQTQDGALWRSGSDGGFRSNDIAMVVGASETSFNNPASFFVTGATAKPAALQTLGINDQDVTTSAFDLQTGALRWSASFDSDLSSDSVASMEINHNNNLVYVPINSNNDIALVDYNNSNGDEVRRRVYPGARANDSAISGAGGFMGVVGSSGGDFLVLSYPTGGASGYDIEDRPVRGVANSADITSALTSDPGSLDVHRTLLVTGKENGFGTGGDVYTTAYNYRDGRKLWAARWGSAHSGVDEGLVAEAAWVDDLGKGVGFVAGRTFSSERGLDVVVIAYDLATGAEMWRDTFDGEVSGDDSPIAMDYSDGTSTLFVTGTSERGFPHGEDVTTFAYDAVTGERKGVAYAAGDSSNGDDAPTGIVVDDDGRAFVSATLVNKFATGDNEIGLIAYDSRLNEIGRRVYGGEGSAVDRSAGVALGVGGEVLVGGSIRVPNNGYDFSASAFDGSLFKPLPIVRTSVDFSAGSATQGSYSDEATLEAVLVDQDGAPLEGKEVTFSLGDRERSSVTDAAGIASSTFVLDLAPGTYPMGVSFAGEEGALEPSRSSASFEVIRDDSLLDLVVEGNGAHRTVIATLTDADSGAGLAGRTIDFYVDGASIGSATTDDGGVATFVPEDGAKGGRRMFEARFSGGEFYLPSWASATS